MYEFNDAKIIEKYEAIFKIARNKPFSKEEFEKAKDEFQREYGNFMYGIVRKSWCKDESI